MRKIVTILVLALCVCAWADNRSNVSRGSSHYIVVDGGVGYSNIIPKGYDGTPAGLVGGRLQVGYEWDFRRLMLRTGIEGASINTLMKPANPAITEKQMQNMVQLNIPVMVGGMFDRFYVMGGLKLGVPVWYKATESLGISKVKTGLNPQLAAEIGWKLTEVGNANRSRMNLQNDNDYRIGLFIDAGLANTSLSQYTNSLLMGIKFTALFGIYRPRKAPKPAYGRVPFSNAPQSWLNIAILNKATRQPISAVLTMHDNNNGEEIRSEVRGGLTKKRARKGDWTLTAQANNYKQDTQSYTLEKVDGSSIDLEFLLENIAQLQVNVTHAVTGKPLAATVTILNADTRETVQTLSVDASGHIATRLQEGPNYRVKIEHLGYEPQIVDIQSIGDIVNASLHPLGRGHKMVIHNILFATNRTDILPASRQPLNELYEFLSENPSMSVRIIGHTDSDGTDEANLKLSQGRCESVKKNMSNRGIAANRMETLGKGESEPIATNDTAEGKAQNRRVEFEIISD